MKNSEQMPDAQCRYEDFVNENAHWLDDYALFMSLKEHFSGAPWNEWPWEIRDRTAPALSEWTEKLVGRIKREKFTQFLFFRQWSALKSYCNQKANPDNRRHPDLRELRQLGRLGKFRVL